jgi:hypothetical protein
MPTPSLLVLLALHFSRWWDPLKVTLFSRRIYPASFSVSFFSPLTLFYLLLFYAGSTIFMCVCCLYLIFNLSFGFFLWRWVGCGHMKAFAQGTKVMLCCLFGFWFWAKNSWFCQVDWFWVLLNVCFPTNSSCGPGCFSMIFNEDICFFAVGWSWAVGQL